MRKNDSAHNLQYNLQGKITVNSYNLPIVN